MEIIFCVILTAGKLIYEAYTKHKADKYADMVVRRY